MYGSPRGTGNGLEKVAVVIRDLVWAREGSKNRFVKKKDRNKHLFMVLMVVSGWPNAYREFPQVKKPH